MKKTNFIKILLLFFCFLAGFEAYAQTTTISGTVKDENSKPLVGVTVFITGTKQGATTDAQGKFSLNTSEKNPVLRVTYIGYLEKTINTATTGVSNIEVNLQPDGKELEGVVVTALGIKRESKALTYNVQEIKGDAISTVKDANFVNALQGKVAGVTINTSSTGIGGGVRVIARGVKSLSGNNNALFVIDGVPLPNLQASQATGDFAGRGATGDGISNINPDDIESMTVLTGPAAAALYGSDAANGAVIITTKKGATGGLKVSLYNNTSFLRAFASPKRQNEYGQSDANAYDGWGAKLATRATYDPNKDFFQTGHNITTGINLSGGTEQNQTFFSAAMVNGSGIIPNNKLTRYNVTLRNTSNFLDDKLHLDLSAMYVNTNEQNLLAQGLYSNPLVSAFTFPAGDDFSKYKYFERFDLIRNLNTQYWNYGQLGYYLENPYWQAYRELFNNYKNRYILSAAAKYDINDWLNISGRVKFDKTSTVSEQKLYASTISTLASAAGNYQRSYLNDQQLYADLLLNMNKKLSSDFELNANIGGVYQNNLSMGLSYGGNLNQVPNVFDFNNVVQGAQAKPSSTGNFDNPVVRQALLANAELSYKKLLFLNLTGRNDWSSTLANTKSEKTGFFYPSVGLSGVISDIKGFKNKYVNFLKIRGSYAEVGNALNPYITNRVYPFQGTSVSTTTYSFLNELKPEKTQSYEIGINSKFLNNKINFDITLYKSNTYNQLFTVVPPASSQFSSYYVNAGNVSNKGIEALLGYNGDFGKLHWNSTLTFTLNRSKILEMLPPTVDINTGETVQLDSVITLRSGGYQVINKAGRQVGDVYVNTLKTDNQGNIYVDPNSGGVSVDNNKLAYAGNTNPKYNIGFRNEFSYKGINLGVVLDGRFGGIVLSQTQATMDYLGASQKTADERNQGGVLVNGVRLPDVRSYYSVVGNGSGVLSQYTYSATNVRLREVYLNYTIPGKWLKNKVQNLNIGLTGRNLMMIYNKAPFDPELTSTTGTYGVGIDNFLQPSLRSFGFSVKVNF